MCVPVFLCCSSCVRQDCRLPLDLNKNVNLGGMHLLGWKYSHYELFSVLTL